MNKTRDIVLHYCNFEYVFPMNKVLCCPISTMNMFQNKIIIPTRSSTDVSYTNMRHLLFVPGTRF